MIDEAHNVPQVAREAGTLRTDAAQVGDGVALLSIFMQFFCFRLDFTEERKMAYISRFLFYKGEKEV